MGLEIFEKESGRKKLKFICRKFERESLFMCDISVYCFATARGGKEAASLLSNGVFD
jgi:hypothetical protein